MAGRCRRVGGRSGKKRAFPRIAGLALSANTLSPRRQK